jgi:hypothetical protein
MAKNRFFNPFTEKKEEVKEEKLSEVFVSKYNIKHFQKITNVENDMLRIPTPGEHFFLQSDTAFNAFTFIPLVAKHHPVKELHASTYSISRKVIDALIELHDKGMIEQVTLMISDSMIKRNPVTIDNLMAMCSTRPNFKAVFAWSHAKVCLLKTHDYHFVIEGSGNWSENAHYEQYIFANDKDVYDFRMQLFTNSNLKKY